VKTRSTRSIQETLDVILNSGTYPKHSHLMCLCVNYAVITGLITDKEGKEVKETVDRYLTCNAGGTKFVELRLALAYHNKPYSLEDRTAIYRDWKNRPSLKPRQGRSAVC